MTCIRRLIFVPSLVLFLALASLLAVLPTTSAADQRTPGKQPKSDGSTSLDPKTLLALPPALAEAVSSGHALYGISLPIDAPEPVALGDVVLFSNADSAAAFFGAQGSAVPQPSSDLFDAVDWTSGAPVWPLGAAFDDGDPDASEAVAFAMPANDLAMVGAGTSGPGPDLELTASDGTRTPLRYVIADGLPLRSQPGNGAATIALLDQGDRVFVQPDLPQIDPSSGVPFVKVQWIESNPVVEGWFPLYWLQLIPGDPTPGTLSIEVGYPFLAKRLAEVVETVFYGDCDGAPLHPHSAFGGQPTYLGPLAGGTLCGELPVGTPTVNGHRRVIDMPLAVGQFSDDLVVYLRFADQFRREEGYPVLDLAENFFGVPGDVSAIRHYSRFPEHESDPQVRIHDTDVWFNVSAEAPQGVDDAGAYAYVNFCFELPGGVLRPDPFRLDTMTATGAYLQSVDLGALAFHPFQLCASAAIRAAGGGDILVQAGQALPPLKIEWVGASLRNVELQVIEGMTINGVFQGSGDWTSAIEAAFSFVMVGSAAGLPFVYETFLEDQLEDLMVLLLNGMTQPIVTSLPDPEAALDAACSAVLGSYATPSSPFYPIYLHCEQATQNASVEPFPGGLDPDHACHRAEVFARVNDGRPWSSSSHDETHFVTMQGDVVTIDRPIWASQCGAGADVETIAPEPFWPVLECLDGTLDEALRYDRLSSLASDGQSACLLPTVKYLCDVYGDGEDLKSMWFGGGPIPQVVDYADYCAWYEVLLEQSQPTGGPAYTGLD